MGVAEGREPWLQRKAGKSRAHREKHKENTSPKLNFISFCNQWSSKTGVSVVPELGWDRDLKILSYSWSGGRQTI